MMKKFITFLFLILVGVLFANPILPGPIITELYRNGENWQISLHNLMMYEFTLDNCALSFGSGFSEFNDGIEFYEDLIVTSEDLQDSLYLDWESDLIHTYFDDGNGLMEIDVWSYSPNGYWSNNVNPLYDSQSLREIEPMMDYEFMLKDSNIENGLRTRGTLEGFVFDVDNNPIENATIEFYRDENWLENIFIPAVTDEQGSFNTLLYAKNYEVSACINGIAYLDSFLTIEPDSTTYVEFCTNYNQSSVGNHDISSPSSHHLSNFPNPFNPSTVISFNLTTEITGNIEIQIFNSKGQKINQFSIFNNQSSISWDGTNLIGKSCPSGVYFYKLVSHGKELAVNKMLLLK
jgi:hypothetical protein